VVFKLKMNGPPVVGGMGTCGLMGPIGVITGWFGPSEKAVSIGYTAYSPTGFDWFGLIIISVVIPAVVGYLVSELMRKKGMITLGDLKVDC